MAGTLRLTNTGGANGQTTITAVGTTDRTVITPDEDGTLLTKDGSGNVAVEGDVQMASQNGGQLAGFRNKIINGDFRVWQRGVTGGGEYVADRWRMSGGSGNTYDRLVNDTDLEVLGFSFGLTNSGPGSSIFGQYIELDHNGKVCQFPNGSQWTWTVWSTAAPTSTLINWSKDDNATSETAATPGSWTSIATQGSWTRYQQTFTIANDPVDTGITSLLVRFNLANGQSVSGCQLEPGPVATPFEHRPIGTELALCKRYYQKLGEGFLIKLANSTSSRGNGFQFTQEMRAVPTCTLFNNASLSALYRSGSAQSAAAPTATISAMTGCIVDEKVVRRVILTMSDTSMSTDGFYVVADDFISADAEL